MKLKKFNTENYECWATKVGEVAIGNEVIPVYEISVKIKENKQEVILPDDVDFVDSKYEQEFLDMAQKLWDEIQKEQPLSLAFIYSELKRYSFLKSELSSDRNPVQGFIEAYTPPELEGYWITWTASSSATDKLEKNEVFRMALEKWALAKFLQLVFGDLILPFSLPRFGSEDIEEWKTEKGSLGFGSGWISVGQLRAYIFWTGTGRETDLPTYAYAIWDEKRENFYFEDNKTLTEEELEHLHKDLT